MIPLPHALSFAGLLAAVCSGLAAFFAFGFGQDHEIARQANENKAVIEAVEKTQSIAASAIASIKVTNAPIRERLEREVRTEQVYRDCVATPAGLRLTNAAITGEVPASGVELSAADANGAR